MSKIYTRRDSITTILRKAGIDKAHYNDYMSFMRNPASKLKLKLRRSQLLNQQKNIKPNLPEKCR
jgi:hypothetical protein